MSKSGAVGVIGLGIMGRPMALNLFRAGFPTIVHNRSRPPMETLAAEGLTIAETPARVAELANTIILMVSDSQQVEAVMHGPSGVLATLRPASLVIDMGTTDVAVTHDIAHEVAEHGASFVDAPVSGGEAGAIDGSLSIMAGGHEADIARALPVLQILGRRITHMGGSGAGQVAKAANQAIVGATIQAVAEALTLAEAAGVDPGRLREALTGGFADSRVLQAHGKRMVEGDFAAGARAATQLKDLDQGLRLAESVGLDLPGLRQARDLYQQLVARGDGALDHSALIRLFRPN